MIELSLHILDITENAVRANARQVFISITEDRLRDRLTLEIRDDGTGMTAGELRRVLDPFYTTKETGTGLGLAVAHRILQNHGGRIDVAALPGAGTSVVLSFPVSVHSPIIPVERV